MPTPAISGSDTDNTTFNSSVGPDIGTVLDSGSGAGNHDGQLILIVTMCDSSHTFTIDDMNYTELFDVNNTNNCSMVCYYKAGVDSETDPTVTIDTGNEGIINYSFAISNWDSNAPLYATDQGVADTDHVCPTVTATKDALVIRIVVHRDSNFTYTTIPETTFDQMNSGSLSSTQIHAGVATTTKNNEATGTATFVASDSSDWLAATIVIQTDSAAGGIPKTSRITLLGVG